ncbi:MAG: hypothetical protein PHT91_01920, partial [Candidatus Nanoarchaeia archaeon]|nr:hypothetical protein [Candidatus Nanoarchaeia archaeon]
PKSKNHERLSNTPKKRYSSIRKKRFIDSMKSIETLSIAKRRGKNAPSKPFIIEFFSITKPNM